MMSQLTASPRPSHRPSPGTLGRSSAASRGEAGDSPARSALIERPSQLGESIRLRYDEPRRRSSFGTMAIVSNRSPFPSTRPPPRSRSGAPAFRSGHDRTPGRSCSGRPRRRGRPCFRTACRRSASRRGANGDLFHAGADEAAIRNSSNLSTAGFRDEAIHELETARRNT